MRIAEKGHCCGNEGNAIQLNERSGWLVAGNSEYSSRVKFCPGCGAVSPAWAKELEARETARAAPEVICSGDNRAMYGVALWAVFGRDDHDAAQVPLLLSTDEAAMREIAESTRGARVVEVSAARLSWRHE